MATAGSPARDRSRTFGKAISSLRGGGPVSPAALLAIIACCYAAAQFLLVGIGVGLAYDEAAYINQFSFHHKPSTFHPSRGWGTALLVAPVVMVTDSITVLRSYLTVVSSLLLFCSFRIWLPVRPGYAVPVAAVLFAGWWPGVFYGNEVMPNLYTAFGTVALTGLMVRSIVSDRPVGKGVPVLIVLVTAVFTLFRPSDALVVIACIAAVTVVSAVLGRRRPALVALAALAGGSVAGFGHWVLEAVRIYGGVPERLALATRSFSEPQWLGGRYVRVLDGPTVCATEEACGPVPAGGLVWLAGVGLLVLVGLLTARRERHRIAVFAAAAVGAGIAGVYLYYAGHTAPRYMLPAYGLWVLVAAEGFVFLAAALRRRTRAVHAVACSLLVLAGYLYAQSTHLEANVLPSKRARAGSVLVTEKIKLVGFRRPCLVYGWNALQIGHGLDCEAVGTGGGRPMPSVFFPEAAARHAQGYTIIAVYRGDVDGEAAYMADWPRYRLTSTDWYARISTGGTNAGVPRDVSER